MMDSKTELTEQPPTEQVYGQTQDTSGVALTVVNGTDGKQWLQCSTNTVTNGHWGYVYKTLNQTYTAIDWQWQVYFSELPGTDGNKVGAGGVYNSAVESHFDPANIVSSVSIIRQNGACYWELNYGNNSQFNSLVATNLTVTEGNWYTIELDTAQGNGNGTIHFRVNGVETLTALNLNNNQNGIDHISVGGGITADRPITWYCASVQATEPDSAQPQIVTNNWLIATPQISTKRT